MQAKMTPLMQQYWEIKAQHPDKVVLFRMGDFFEMFHSDAETAAPILGIALTQRNKKDSESAKMCGVPYHTIATPIAKLLAAGHKVAICDQIEDPALAKGLVKRAVTRVLTPGMVYDPDTLDQLSANYLCAFDDSTVAFVDITTGEAFYYAVQQRAEVLELLQLLTPAEIVVTPAQKVEWALNVSGLISVLPTSETESTSSAVERLQAYIVKLQGQEVLQSIGEFARRERHTSLRLSATLLHHLEVFTNSRGEKNGDLFSAILRTQTSGGARLLRSWLMAPLTSVVDIEKRLDEVALWVDRPAALKTFRATLSRLGDVERRLGKVHSTTFNARDLAAIAESLLVGLSLYPMHPGHPSKHGLEPALHLAEKILRYLNEELPIGIKEGGMIRQGVVSELDELITLTDDTQKLLLDLEGRERQATGIASLKVRYNSVFGFYIELTKAHSTKAPAHYMRKQTLTNAERYTTDELNRLEEKILAARSKRDQLELQIFSQLRQEVVELAIELAQLSRQWSHWDVLSSLAWLALERGYCRPTFEPSGALHLELCRHPVVEMGLSQGFVANTVHLEPGDCMLLTGPNMAGKSTLMRQVALTSIMAQIGSFVPANSAVLPVFQQIFTRIGASDSLSEGLSTFMVEMSETSEILKKVNSHTLVIMDEIGRGTSTYDGLSLAQSILEFLVSQKRPYLLFATHYHELTQLNQTYPTIHNAHMSVQERHGEIQFLHSLKQGPANRSYGIHVAKLAGIPVSVTARAQQILSSFESQAQREVQLSLTDILANPMLQPSQPVETPQWLEDFKAANLSHMTPLEALNKLFEWQREASS